MKILYVGNPASVASHLCDELSRQGHTVELIAKANSACLKRSDGGSEQYTNNTFEEITLKGMDLSHYDIIHVHYLINWLALGMRLRSRKGKVVLHCHGCDVRPATILHKAILRFVAQLSDILFHSTPDLLERTQWFKGRRLYLPNPIRTDGILPTADKHKDRVLIFGTLYRIKQTERLFAIIEKSRFKFDIFAIGPAANYYKQIAPANVHWIAPVRREEVPAAIARYSLVLGTSQDGTIRVSELEAMAAGIPTLFPFRFNEHYPEPLPMPSLSLASIDKHFGDNALGKRQRDWVLRYHDRKVVAERLLKIYEEVL